MTPQLYDLSPFCKILKISGIPELLKTLFKVFQDKGRSSRAVAIKSAADVFLQFEEAQSVRMDTLEKLRQLMVSAGFDDDAIRYKLNESLNCENAALSLEKIIEFIEKGKIDKILLRASE